MRFEAVLSLRMLGTSDEARLQAFREQHLTPEAWARIDEEHIRILHDDLRAARTRRSRSSRSRELLDVERRPEGIDEGDPFDHRPGAEVIARATSAPRALRRSRRDGTGTARPDPALRDLPRGLQELGGRLQVIRRGGRLGQQGIDGSPDELVLGDVQGREHGRRRGRPLPGPDSARRARAALDLEPTSVRVLAL